MTRPRGLIYKRNVKGGGTGGRSLCPGEVGLHARYDSDIPSLDGCGSTASRIGNSQYHVVITFPRVLMKGILIGGIAAVPKGPLPRRNRAGAGYGIVGELDIGGNT